MALIYPTLRVLAALLLAGAAAAALAVWYLAPDASFVYRQGDDYELRLHVYGEPAVGGERPALVLFHGGGWTYGSPYELAPLARRLADGTRQVILPEYRLAATHGSDAFDARDDALEALRWILAQNRRLGVDPERVTLGGASAGGQLAAHLGLRLPGRVLGLVLLAPVTDTSAPALRAHPAIARLFRGRGEEVSPLHQVRRDAPATLILHGAGDTVVPLRASEIFCQALRQSGNLCELRRREGASHRFFKLPWHWPWVGRQAEAALRRWETGAGASAAH